MKIDWKKAIGLTAAVAMLVPLAACGGSNEPAGSAAGSRRAPKTDAAGVERRRAP